MPKKKREKAKEPLSKARKLKIRIVGLGGGGSSIVSEMSQELKGVSFLVADSDNRVFKKIKGRTKAFQFGKNFLRGMGTGMNLAAAEKAARLEKEKIAKIFQGQDISILVISLGGGIGSGAGLVFSEAIKEQKGISLGIFTLPFEFEGDKKMKIAKHSLAKLQENLSGTIVVPNEKIFKITSKKITLKKAFSSLNQVFVQWLQGLIEIISKPNLINIDFADLKTILKEKGKKLFFDQEIGQGQNRGEDVVKKLFHNPIFDGEPRSVKRILFNIAGGNDLELKEIEQISEAIAKLNPRAKIIFGISQIPGYKGKIKATLLAVSDLEEKKISHRKPGKEGNKKAKKRKANSPSAGQKVKIENNSASKQDKGKNVEKPEKAKKVEKNRRNALEVKKATEIETEKEWLRGGTDWEIPAFIRKKNKK